MIKNVENVEKDFKQQIRDSDKSRLEAKRTRGEARRKLTVIRDQAPELKNQLKALIVGLKKAYISNSSDQLDQLADDMMECSGQLVANIRKFAEQKRVIENNTTPEVVKNQADLSDWEEF